MPGWLAVQGSPRRDHASKEGEGDDIHLSLEIWKFVGRENVKQFSSIQKNVEEKNVKKWRR